MKKTELVFPGIEGNLVLQSFVDDDGKVVALYGDELGLKSLARLLASIADLNQDELPEVNLPTGHGYHLHVNPESQLNKESESLIIGRLDGKKTGDTEWMCPPIPLRNKLREDFIEILEVNSTRQP